MRMKFLAIPDLSPEPAAGELASFLAGHRILAIDRHLVHDGSASFWAVCVLYQQTSAEIPATKQARVDYREVLPERDFAVYARLRDLRKTLAQREAVPPYTIFTNEQLAAIATQRPASKAALATISGVGSARIDKHGDAVLELLRALEQPTTNSEASPP